MNDKIEIRTWMLEITNTVSHLCRVVADPETPRLSDRAKLTDLAEKLERMTEDSEQPQ